ncbi:acyl-CoA dehydrogenase family protein [Microbacterium rhizomatis]|uniref:Acyl-CoA dehydrogenase n=1 Tax=Microbacterium rhizomatis TaxID=1631477 RepID=A0A5J5J100_9MICO|nr:acyl-CoA dehydrogenase family protein [Microbacterium rhizomatis]KAA9108201.1 acyl-CoA dehydrogenase [Microbacterium rhizomatis]
MIETDVDTERRELAELSDDLLERFCSVEHLRGCLDQGRAHSPELWGRLAEAGLISAIVGEDFGGIGLTPAHLSGVLYNLGRHAAPEPFLETAVVAATVLGASSWPEASAWLERVAAGDAIVAIRLDGAPHVAFARDADLLLDIGQDDSVRVFTADQLEITDLDSLDALRPVTAVAYRTEGVALPVSADSIRYARALAIAGAACLLAGATNRLLELTVDYVTLRRQFDRPVGSFQAVKHKIADVAVMADMARSAALSAIDGAGEPAGFRRAAAAKAYAGDAAHLANVHALQLHGGIGFTWEYHLHIWLKRAMSLSAAYGTTRSLRRALARDLLAEIGGAGSR